MIEPPLEIKSQIGEELIMTIPYGLKKNELTGREMLKVYKKDREQKREELVEATRAKKVYEKLKDKLHEAHEREMNLPQQKEQDELAGQMIQHKKSSHDESFRRFAASHLPKCINRLFLQLHPAGIGTKVLAQR